MGKKARPVEVNRSWKSSIICIVLINIRYGRLCHVTAFCQQEIWNITNLFESRLSWIFTMGILGLS